MMATNNILEYLGYSLLIWTAILFVILIYSAFKSRKLIQMLLERDILPKLYLKGSIWPKNSVNAIKMFQFVWNYNGSDKQLSKYATKVKKSWKLVLGIIFLMIGTIVVITLVTIVWIIIIEFLALLRLLLCLFSP